MKSILITHNDLDGIFCYILAYLYQYGKYDEIMICDYEYRNNESEKFIKKLISYDKIIFTDFSPTKEQLLFLKEKEKIIEIYDHHESALELKEIDNSFIIDISMCGTKLFFEYVIRKNRRIKTIVSEIINLVDIYDRYQTGDPLWERALNLNRLFYKQLSWKIKEDCFEKYSIFFQSLLVKIQKMDKFFFTENEKRLIQQVIQKEEQVYNDAIKKMQIRIDIKGNKFAITEMGSKISIVCNKILTENKDITYITVINTFNNIYNGKIHIRSQSDFHILQNIPGTSGHSNASALNLKEDDILNYLNGTYKDLYKIYEINNS